MLGPMPSARRHVRSATPPTPQALSPRVMTLKGQRDPAWALGKYRRAISTHPVEYRKATPAVSTMT